MKHLRLKEIKSSLVVASCTGRRGFGTKVCCSVPGGSRDGSLKVNAGCI